jgi:DNA-binding GntR family transcriptional regulator
MKARQAAPRTNRLRQKLHSTLLHWIVSGELEAGKPVKESRLAAELKVSRTPLREALLQLEGEGFVRSDERRGFSVERMSPRELGELYPMIWTLEGLALRSNAVCAHLPVEDLQWINFELAKTRNILRALQLDTRWHEQLTGQSRNTRLNETLAALRMALRRYERVYMSDARLVLESAAQHDAIIRALKERDIERAIKGVEENWRFGMEVLITKMCRE